MRWIDLGRVIGLIALFSILNAIMHVVSDWPMDRRGNFWLAIALTILWAIRDQQEARHGE